MQIKTLLTFICCSLAVIGFGQTPAATVTEFRHQVEDIADNDGRAKALMINELGLKYLAPNDPTLKRLRYETYYNGGTYDEEITDAYSIIFNDISWSPSGSQLAVALSDGSIRIYESSNLAEYQLIEIGDADEEASTLGVDWSPNGKYLAYCTSTAKVGYYNLTTKSKETEWEEGDFLRAVAWSPDGKRIASGGDENTLFVYNIQTSERERAFEGHSDWIRSVAWSADGTMVAAASDDNTATVWSITQGNLMRTHRNHEDYCRQLDFAPKGTSLVTVSDDLNVFVYEAATDEIPERNLRGHEGWVKAVDWAPNNRAVATADQDGVIIVHQLKNGAQQFLNAYDEETSWEDLAFAPDSKQLAVLSSYELAVYNLSNPKEVSRCSPEQTLTSTVTGNDQADQANRLENTLNRLLPTAVSLYPDPTSDRLGIIDEAYQLNVINGESGEELFLIDGHEDWIRNIDWSTNGQLLATASDDMMVGVWSAETGEMQHLLAGHTDWVRDVAFSPDNKVLASASDDGIIRIWDPEAGDELASTDKLDVFLMTVDWSPGQSYFASQSNDNSIHVWSAKNNELLHSFYEATSTGTLKWTDDNTFTVIGSEGGRFVWDGGEELATTDGAAIRSNSEQGTSATANGPYITVSGNGEEVFLAGHRSDIVQLDWSPDGTYLVSQAADGQLGIWTPSTSSAAHALLNLSDGIGKPLIWSKDGAGFYTTGASNKVLLPTDRLRLSASDTKAALSGEDILRFGLESTLLTDPAVVERLQASAPAEFLRAVADFYAARADAKGEATGQADAAKAAAFRAAADR